MDFYWDCNVFVNFDILIFGIKIKCIEVFLFGVLFICMKYVSIGVLVFVFYY